MISFEKSVVNSVPMIARARRDLSNYNDVYKKRCWSFNAGGKYSLLSVGSEGCVSRVSTLEVTDMKMTQAPSLWNLTL